MTRKKALKKKTMFLHVVPKTKAGMKALAKKQPGHVSLSTLAERAFQAVLKNPKLIRAA